MRRRLEQRPTDRWYRWATATNPSILTDAQWSSIADRLDHLHQAGSDIGELRRRLTGTPVSVLAATLAQHQPGAAIHVDWRPWAHTVQPSLLKPETWPQAQADLTRLQASGINPEALTTTLAGRTPGEIATAIRNVLRNQQLQTQPQRAPQHQQARSRPYGRASSPYSMRRS